MDSKEIVNLAKNNLEGTLPKVMFSKLTRLVQFNLNSNQISGNIPTEVEFLRDLSKCLPFCAVSYQDHLRLLSYTFLKTQFAWALYPLFPFVVLRRQSYSICKATNSRVRFQRLLASW
jgi:hypothetical protein